MKKKKQITRTDREIQNSKLAEMIENIVRSLTDELRDESNYSYIEGEKLSLAYAMIKEYQASNNSAIAALKKALVDCMHTLMTKTVDGTDTLIYDTPTAAIRVVLQLAKSEAIDLEADVETQHGTSKEEHDRILKESGTWQSTT